MLTEFKKYVRGRGIVFSDADFEANKEYIRRMIKAEVFQDRIGVAEAARVLLDADPQVLEALKYMPEAKQLSQNKTKRQVAQR